MRPELASLISARLSGAPGSVHTFTGSNDVQAGASIAPAVSLAALLAQNLTISPPLRIQGPEPVDVAVPVHRISDQGGVVGVVVFDTEAPPTVLSGDLARFGDGWALDGRRELAAASLSTGDEEIVVGVFPDGTVQLVSMTPDPISWTPPPPDIGGPPSLDALLAGASCLSCVRRHLEALASSEWPLDRVAAVGGVARLWRPESLAEVKRAVASRSSSPSARARGWSSELSDSALDDIGHMAFLDVEELWAMLDEVGEVEEEDEGPYALAVARRRDALTSVLEVIPPGELAGDLAAALRAVDDAFTAEWSALPPAGILEAEDWLIEVAAADPDAWWSAWALP